MAALAGVVVGWLVFGHFYGLFLNQSESVPGTVFLYQRDTLPTRGDMVVFDPPPNPYHRELFLKIVGGVAGDVVSMQNREFSVDGHVIGRAKEISLKGKPLAPGPTGVIGAGQFFVYGTHRDSYDSRYKDIGWIDSSRIIGRAWRLF